MLPIHEMPEHMAALIDSPEIDEEEIFSLMLQQIVESAGAFFVGEHHLVPELARRQHSVIKSLGVLRNVMRVEPSQVCTQLLGPVLRMRNRHDRVFGINLQRSDIEFELRTELLQVEPRGGTN